MALVGACFSIAFTFGPAMGAALANVTLVAANPFATAAGVSLLLILIETIYLYLCLPETRPPKPASPISNALPNGSTTKPHISPPTHRTNPPILLNLTHFLFLLPFSGLEFSLPFLLTTTLYPSHPSPSKLNGRLLGFIGLIASSFKAASYAAYPPHHRPNRNLHRRPCILHSRAHHNLRRVIYRGRIAGSHERDGGDGSE